MKKALLFSILFFIATISVMAYETIIIHYPEGELWEKAFYKKTQNEALLQYVPAGQTTDNWTRSIVIHSYKDLSYPVNVFVNNSMLKLVKANPTAKYKTLRSNHNEAILTRCTNDYKETKGQCEFYRATRAHEGIITIHYLNRNKKDFMNNYTLWLETIRNIKFYNSYFRDERTFDKSEYYELW